MAAKRQTKDALSKGGGASAKDGARKGGTSKTASASKTTAASKTVDVEKQSVGGERFVARAAARARPAGRFVDSRGTRSGVKRAEGLRRMGAAPRESAGEAVADRSVRSLFLRRMNAWSESLAETAPAEVLADALAHPSARSSILYVLDAVPPNEEKSEAEVLRERALQRALAVREELAREAGGMRSTQWVAEHLDVKRQSVDRYRREGKLLAWETPQGYAFPACQFDEDGVVSGLPEVLAEMRDLGFWEALSGLLTPTPTLDGESVLGALRKWDPEERGRIREVARAYAHE